MDRMHLCERRDPSSILGWPRSFCTDFFRFIDVYLMKVTYSLYNITQVHQEEIKTIVQKNIDGKLSSYIKSFPADAMKQASIKIEKNKKNRYV